MLHPVLRLGPARRQSAHDPPGRIPAGDRPADAATIEAIERELVEGDFVLRYRTADSGEVDGLSGREGAFLACSFWLVDCLTLLGRRRDARRLLDRLLELRNDLGLLSEEYDPVAGRLVGNFPQAFSHVSLVNSAAKVGGNEKPSPDHVFLGMARQAMSGRATAGRGRHLAAGGVPVLERLATKVAERSGRARPTTPVEGTTAAGRTTGRAARKAMAGSGAPSRRARPTSTSRSPLGATGKSADTKAAANKKTAAKKATAKKATTAKRATTAKKAKGRTTTKKATKARTAVTKKATTTTRSTGTPRARKR